MNTLPTAVENFVSSSQFMKTVLFESELFANYQVHVGYKNISENAVSGWIELLEYLKANNIAFAVVTAHGKDELQEMLDQSGLNNYFNLKNSFFSEKRDDGVIDQYFNENGLNRKLLQYPQLCNFAFAAAQLGSLPPSCLAICSNGFSKMSISSTTMKTVFANTAPKIGSFVVHHEQPLLKLTA